MTGRRRRRQRASDQPRDTTRYRRLTNPFAPSTAVSDDRVDAIHQGALAVLRDHGIRVLLPEARRHFSDGGATVDEDSMMVHFDPEMVEAVRMAAPPMFDVVPRNPERSFTFGGRAVVFSPVAGPPAVHDLERGKRVGTLEDFRNFVILAQHFDAMHMNNPSVEPQDVDLEFRHLEVTGAMLVASDKAPFVYARGRGQVTDCFEMMRIAHGVGHDEFAEVPRCYTVINTNSPRQLDIPMCMGLIQFAERGQVSVITPFTLAGAMAPVSLAGALTLQHAEALAAIVLTQLVKPGAPILYGAFTSNVDMKSGAPAFGTPEGVLTSVVSGQLARYLDLPWRSSAVSTSNTPDVQAGYETSIDMMGAVMGGAHLINHAAGWMESGLTASYEKFITDMDLVHTFAEMFQPVDTSVDEIAVDAIGEVPPGSHFFGIDHTLQRYGSAFYEPLTFTRQNHGQWVEAGSLTAAQRATPIWKQIVADAEPPPFDEATRAELEDFIARRTAEGGAPPES